MNKHHHITVASYTADNGKKRLGIFAAAKPFSKGGKLELVCALLGPYTATLTDAKNILRGVTVELSVAYQRSAAVAAEARAEVVQVGHNMAVIGDERHADYLAEGQRERKTASLQGEAAFVRGDERDGGGYSDYRASVFNAGYDFAQERRSAIEAGMNVSGEAKPVDFTKSTLAAPPSVVTIQTDTRSNADIMEATRKRLMAERMARDGDHVAELLDAVAQDKAHAEAVALTTPDAGQAAFMGFAIAAGVYTGNGNNPVRLMVDALPGGERGHVELWDEIAPYAVPLARIYGAMDDQPGVFAYEVAEEFGAWFHRCTVENKATPSADECKAEIARLCGEFYAMGDGYFAAMI